MTDSLRVAGVDCGTNSIRLLIVEVNPDGSLSEISRRNTIVRLGQGVDESGELAPEAIERTRVALAGYVDEMVREGVKRVRMVATSAMRDVKNRDEFFAMTRALLSRVEVGKHADVISGAEEAKLSFAGATADLDPQRGPFCVIDLGGGSTEFVTAQDAISTRMGCVRLTERFLQSDPPTEDETAQTRAYVRERLTQVASLIDASRTFIGCAGTFTTLSALTQGLDMYEPQRIHMSELPIDALRTTTRTLRKQTADERRANPVIHPGRADVIAAGSLIVEEILDLAESSGLQSVVISEKDILDGIVASLLEGH
ncbi:Ppx/GppA phosphatase family protein [Corynebacterium mayonis]|uniref:Ppx/GppA phosphatase family protein n=1 Tax=Corynebacterium mayonis TaxID=3062461 RepID=UPI003140A8CA